MFWYITSPLLWYATYCMLFSNFTLDEESSKSMKKMSEAVDTWAEYIRVDPADLILNEPYHRLIFQPMVSST